MSGNHETVGPYNFSRDRTPPAATGSSGPIGRFELTAERAKTAAKASLAARKRKPVDVDFDSALARLKIILDEFYPDDDSQ